MIVYRLSKAKYKDELSGYGASIFGQRWNSKGVKVIYAAESRALALSEIAVHIPFGIVPKDYFVLEIEISSSIKIKHLKKEELPITWQDIPHTSDSQLIGDEFVRKGDFAVLRVPSVVVKGDFNYVINPQHKDFRLIKIIDSYPFSIDQRLIKR